MYHRFPRKSSRLASKNGAVFTLQYRSPETKLKEATFSISLPISVYECIYIIIYIHITDLG